MRKEQLAEKELYHIYNRGVDKRPLFLDEFDIERFIKSMREFNSIKPIGSIYENRTKKRKTSISSATSEKSPLVRFVAYGINSNHYHFALEQVAEKGIEKFMHRLGLGYSKYFNHKYNRSGVLFQGPFRSIRIDSNEYLLHLSVYINRNNEAHNHGNGVSTLSRSSWDEYIGNYPAESALCDKTIILGQFKNPEDYKIYAEDALKSIIERKILISTLEEPSVETGFPHL